MSLEAGASLQQFRYGVLDDSKREFRLLQPSIGDDGIVRVQLKAFDFDSTPPYRCVSYVWGPPPATKLIRLGDAYLMVRKNLYKFLKYYVKHSAFVQCGSSTSAEWLFADQISINQADLNERNHQVQMMADIYANAASVLAWLGVFKNDEPDLAITTPFQWCWKIHPHIADNIFWTRLWIIPELSITKTFDIVIGQVVIGEDDFMDYCRLFSNDYPIFKFLRGMRRSRGEGDHFRSYSIDSSKRLSLISRAVVGLQCEDPRDRIFAIQALYREQDRLPVDYSCSVSEVMRRMGLLMLRSCKSFNEVWDVADWAADFHTAMHKGAPDRWWTNLRNNFLSRTTKGREVLAISVIYDAIHRSPIGAERYFRRRIVESRSLHEMYHILWEWYQYKPVEGIAKHLYWDIPAYILFWIWHLSGLATPITRCRTFMNSWLWEICNVGVNPPRIIRILQDVFSEVSLQAMISFDTICAVRKMDAHGVDIESKLNGIRHLQVLLPVKYPGSRPLDAM